MRLRARSRLLVLGFLAGTALVVAAYVVRVACRARAEERLLRQVFGVSQSPDEALRLRRVCVRAVAPEQYYGYVAWFVLDQDVDPAWTRQRLQDGGWTVLRDVPAQSFAELPAWPDEVRGTMPRLPAIAAVLTEEGHRRMLWVEETDRAETAFRVSHAYATRDEWPLLGEPTGSTVCFE